MDHLKLAVFGYLVNLRVVLAVLCLLQIQVRSDAKPAFERELYGISAYAAEGVENVCLSEHVVSSLRDVFDHWFRSNRVPAFVVDPDPSVELTKQVIPFFPVLLQLVFSRLWGLLVPIVVSFGSFVAVKAFLVGFKLLRCSFEHDDYLSVLPGVEGYADLVGW